MSLVSLCTNDSLWVSLTREMMFYEITGFKFSLLRNNVIIEEEQLYALTTVFSTMQFVVEYTKE